MKSEPSTMRSFVPLIILCARNRFPLFVQILSWFRFLSPSSNIMSYNLFFFLSSFHHMLVNIRKTFFWNVKIFFCTFLLEVRVAWVETDTRQACLIQLLSLSGGRTAQSLDECTCAKSKLLISKKGKMQSHFSFEASRGDKLHNR